jgi:hypothetical protein
MKKLKLEQLSSIKGGCNRWLRRATRADEGNHPEVRDAALAAFKECIAAKYE